MPASLEDLRETLTASSGANNLVPKIIDRLLLEYQRKWAPLHKAIPRKTWETNTYYFNNRTGLPVAQMTTEAPSVTDVVASQSSYNQLQFPIKNMQSQLDISTVAAKVATVNGNLFQLELAGAAQAMAWQEEILHLYGAQAATMNSKRPQWDGVDRQIGSANKIDAGSSTVTLSNLDSLIDAIGNVAAQELGTDWFYAVTPRMASKINQLFVNQQRFNEGMTTIFARDDYGFPNAPVGDNMVHGGLEVATYRGIPIVKDSMLNTIGQMGAISTTANAGTGSSLSTSTTYWYVVEAVTNYGLLYGSAEVSASPASSGNNITLSWTTPTLTDALGNPLQILGYRIFRSTSTGTETLYALVSALNASDSAITSFTDTGLPQDPTASVSVFAQTVAKSGSNAAPAAQVQPPSQTAANSGFPAWLTGSQANS